MKDLRSLLVCGLVCGLSAISLGGTTDVWGRVVDSRGYPVEHADVWYSSAYEPALHQLTSQKGTFRFGNAQPSNRFGLVAYKHGYAYTTSAVAQNALNKIVLHAAAPATVHAIDWNRANSVDAKLGVCAVVDHGVRVDFDPYFPQISAVTDRSGDARFLGTPEGGEIFVVPEHGITQPLAKAVRASGGGTATILLAHPTEAYGKVYLRDTGEPVVGALVQPFPYMANGVVYTRSTTDSNGEYRFQGLPGPYDIYIKLPGNLKGSFAAVDHPKVVLVGEKSTHLNFEVVRGAKVRGTVLLNHRAVTDSSVQLRSKLGAGATQPVTLSYSARVDKEGHFSLVVAPGEYDVVGFYSRGNESFESLPLTIKVRTDLKIDVVLHKKA